MRMAYMGFGLNKTDKKFVLISTSLSEKDCKTKTLRRASIEGIANWRVFCVTSDTFLSKFTSWLLNSGLSQPEIAEIANLLANDLAYLRRLANVGNKPKS